MNVKEVMARLPQGIQEQAKGYRERYNKYISDGNYEMYNETRVFIRGWCTGLQSAGMITEVERQRIFSYMTL